MADKNIFLNRDNDKPKYDHSSHDWSYTSHLSARFGRLIPASVMECPPGTYLDIRPNMDFDLMPMTFPLQSKVTAHLSFFSVPMRILWDNFDDFLTGVGNHVLPYIKRGEMWCPTGSLADYMNMPTEHIDESTQYSFKKRSKQSFVQTTFTSVPENTDFLRSDYYVLYPLSSPYAYIGESEKLDFSPDAGTTIYVHVFSNHNINSAMVNKIHLYAFYERHGLDNSEDYLRCIRLFSSVSNMTSLPRTVNGVNLYDLRLSFENFDLNEHNIIDELIDNGWDVRLACYIEMKPTNYLFNFNSGVISGSSLSGETSKIDYTLDAFSVEYGFSDFVSTYSRIYSSAMQIHPFIINPSTGEPDEPIPALPFRAYEFIYNYFFRNRKIDPFTISGVEQSNNFLSNKGDGGDALTPVDFNLAPYEYDYFTTCLTNPQLGNAPLVGATTNSSDVIEQIMHFVPRLPNGDPDTANAYDVGVEFDAQTGSAIGITNYSENANKTNLARLTDLIKFGVSINDLRQVSAYQIYLEKSQRTDGQYEKYNEEFYGITPPTGENFPVYIGGFDRVVSIGKLQSTAETQVGDNPVSPLGSFAGVGQLRMAANDNPIIRTFLPEWSYVIGILWFSVTPVYTQTLPRMFMRRTKLDFFHPLFNSIPPQPIYKKELAILQQTAEERGEVFGYQAPWREFCTRLDEAHGAFRNTMKDYLLQRQFFTPPDLTTGFIYIHPEDLTNIFSYTIDDDKIFGAIHFNIKSTNEVAQRSTPHIMV